MENRFEQEGGDSSQNVQVAGDVAGDVKIGITATEARQIALDVFKANCYDLSEMAKATLLGRVGIITERIITEYFERMPDKIEKLQSPAVQYSLLETQKEYGKTGDEQLKDYLSEIFLQRVNSPERSLKQIVLDEVITLLPKLTNEQINILSLIVSAIYLNHNDVINMISFTQFCKHELLDFYLPRKKEETFYTHLQYTGCCVLLSEGGTFKPLIEICKKRYAAFFSKGFSNVELIDIFGMENTRLRPILIPHLSNKGLLQFNAMNEGVLDAQITQNGLSDLRQKIIQLNNSKLMTDNEGENYLNGIDNRFSELSSDWRGTELKTIRPTPVGFVIGLLNYNKKTGKNIDIEAFV